MTQPTILSDATEPSEVQIGKERDSWPNYYLTEANAPPPDNGELGIYTGKEAIVFDWFCDRGMQPPTTEEIEDLLNRLAAKSEWRTPEGWKLVPIEPTPEMNNEGYEADVYSDFDVMKAEEIDELIHRVYPRIYKAMLTAAPEPPMELTKQVRPVQVKKGRKK